jgi:hypothetical protein
MFRLRRNTQKDKNGYKPEHEGRTHSADITEFERRLSEEARRYEHDLRELAKR